jgi:hypothetical protein
VQVFEDLVEHGRLLMLNLPNMRRKSEKLQQAIFEQKLKSFYRDGTYQLLLSPL